MEVQQQQQHQQQQQQQQSTTNTIIHKKKRWNFLRIIYFMLRRGFMSKRKLIIDMNLMMKRGKLIRKTLGNLMFHHHQHHNESTNRNISTINGGFRSQDYEFSCGNSPNPVFFHISSKRKHNYFPCINPPQEEEEDEQETDESRAVVVVPKIGYSPEYSYNFTFSTPDLAPGDKFSPAILSPFSIRVSNYSSDDEEGSSGGGIREIDGDAEEFIRRFYEQLKLQSRTQLLQYQETQFQEMLARGTR